MMSYSYPKEKRNSDNTNLLRFLFFEKAGWYVALIGRWIGINANTMSFISCIPALLALYMNVKYQYLISVILMAIYYLLDNADGHLARMNKNTSPFGSYLDDTIGIILWSFYWGSFIFSVDTPILQATVVISSFSAEGRSLFGFKYKEKSLKGLDTNKQSVATHQRSLSFWRPKNLFLQITNVGGLFFVLFPLLLLYDLNLALVTYGVLFLLRYLLLAINYGSKLWNL